MQLQIKKLIKNNSPIYYHCQTEPVEVLLKTKLASSRLRQAQLDNNAITYLKTIENNSSISFCCQTELVEVLLKTKLASSRLRQAQLDNDGITSLKTLVQLKTIILFTTTVRLSLSKSF